MFRMRTSLSASGHGHRTLSLVSLALAAAAFLGGAPAADASPLRRVPLGVPTILVHGTADDTIPFEDSVRYADAAGDEARVVRLEGAGHFEPVDPQAAEWQIVAAEIERSLGLG